MGDDLMEFAMQVLDEVVKVTQPKEVSFRLVAIHVVVGLNGI